MLIDKKQLPLVAMEFMNEVHLEDVDIINELFEKILKYEKNHSTQNEQKLNKQYKKWIEHTVKHFQNEEEMMQQKKFPPYLMHKKEHQYALDRMQEILEQWQNTKNINILKDYMSNELLKWLTNHIQTMDTVTAMFLKTGLSPCAMQHKI